MAIGLVRMAEPGASWIDAEVWHLPGQGVGLRIDYGGTGVMPIESIIETPEWKAKALTGFRTIEPCTLNLNDDPEKLWKAEAQDNGIIDLQLSVDGGNTWLYFAAAWVPAGAGDWTSFWDLNANLSTIPLGITNAIKLRIRMRRGATTRGPIFAGLRIGYDTMPGIEQEDPFRTLFELIVNRCTVNLMQVFSADGSDKVDVKGRLPIAIVSAAYNLTTDPARQTNLATGTFTETQFELGFESQIIDLSAAQTSGDDIEVHWSARPKIIISNADTDFNDAKFQHQPSWILQVLSGIEDKQSFLPIVPTLVTKNFVTKTYWRERPPRTIDYRVNIYSLAADEVLSIKMSSALYECLLSVATSEVLRSYLTGEEVDLLDFVPPFANLTDTSEKLAVKSTNFLFHTREWRGTIEQGPFAEEVELLITPD